MNLTVKKYILTLTLLAFRTALFALIILASGYVVFVMDRSGWWFIWTAIFLLIADDVSLRFENIFEPQKRICDECRTKFTIQNNYCDYGYNTQKRDKCEHFEPLWTEKSKAGHVEQAKEETEIKLEYKINFPIFEFPPNCGNCSHTKIKIGGLFLYCDKGHERRKQFDLSTFSCDDYDPIPSGEEVEPQASEKEDKNYCANCELIHCDDGVAICIVDDRDTSGDNEACRDFIPMKSEKERSKCFECCYYFVSSIDGMGKCSYHDASMPGLSVACKHLLISTAENMEEVKAALETTSKRISEKFKIRREHVCAECTHLKKHPPPHTEYWVCEITGGLMLPVFPVCDKFINFRTQGGNKQ